MYKAYKFRMYPTNEQKIVINQFLGTSRFIYNHYLNERVNYYKEYNKTYKIKDIKKSLVSLQEEFEWLKSIDSCVLRTSLDDLDVAYDKFFNINGGFPKFKKRNNHDTYRTSCIRSSYKGTNYSNIKVNLEEHYIKLPKLDKIKIRGYRNLKIFDKKIINATVSKEADRYYVSVCVEENDIQDEVIVNKAIGLDLGIKDLIVTSDGIKYAKISFISRMEKRLKGLQKALSRTIKGSINRYKLIIKIQRLYLKIRNAKKYYTHQITSNIVKNNELIITEDLSVIQMLETSSRKLSHNIQNSSFRMILDQLQYKCEWSNKKFIKVNKYFPSSKLCNRCNCKKEELDLTIRRWTCKECGNENDRDINASINILFEGIKMYYLNCNLE